MVFLRRTGTYLRRQLKLLKKYIRISKSDEIVRRYFAMNSFDGTLTTLGIVIGSYVSGVHEQRVVIMTGLGAAVAMGVSGFWGAYETEKAERRRSLRALERATLSSLQDTAIERAADFATVLVSLVDGISPFLAALLVMSPFFLDGILTEQHMYIAGIAISFLSLGLLGAYLGKLSKTSILAGSLKMVVAGILCAVLSLLLIGGAA